MHSKTPAVGETFTSPSKTLTDAHFLFFAGLTGDNHPIHYDVEYARKMRFGKPLAHGLLLASMTALGASPANSRIDGFVFIEQGCRFLQPVVIGDTITPCLVVEKHWQEGRRHFVRLITKLTNQHGAIVLEGFQVYQILETSQSAQLMDAHAGS
jgi:3-hydroxybutyryl-CoA dehydratase